VLAHLRLADFPRGARIPSKIKTCHVPGRHSICSWQKSSTAPLLTQTHASSGGTPQRGRSKGFQGTSSPVMRVPHPAHLCVRAAQKKAQGGRQSLTRGRNNCSHQEQLGDGPAVLEGMWGVGADACLATVGSSPPRAALPCPVRHSRPAAGVLRPFDGESTRFSRHPANCPKNGIHWTKNSETAYVGPRHTLLVELRTFPIYPFTQGLRRRRQGRPWDRN